VQVSTLSLEQLDLENNRLQRWEIDHDMKHDARLTREVDVSFAEKPHISAYTVAIHLVGSHAFMYLYLCELLMY
jgi:hypothetical protein